MISEQYKAVFVHIPKTGGTTIGNIVHPNIEDPEFKKKYSDVIFGENKHFAQHKTYSFYKKRIQDHKKDIKDYFVFSFIRNPYDRIFSYWKMIYKHYNIIKNPVFIDMVEKIYPWSKEHITEISKNNFLHFVSNPECVKITGLMNEFIIPSQANFIGRFENFNQDLLYVLNHIGIDQNSISHFNKNSEKDEYKSYYDQATADIVYRLFEKDFEVFEYSKNIKS